MHQKASPENNPMNQTAINLMKEGYDLAGIWKNKELRYGFNNAINALRCQKDFINAIEQAMSIEYIKDTMGLFIVEAAADSIPTRLIALREETMMLYRNEDAWKC